jgi:hypothetical protein
LIPAWCAICESTRSRSWQPGEVLDAGGKVVTVIDLADVYTTIFLPAVAAALRAARDRHGGFRRRARALPAVGEPLMSMRRVESCFAPR